MNTKILLLALGVVLFTSCTTAYKSGQTPDDVYYSPAKEQPAYVNVEERQERSEYRRSGGNNNYNSYDNGRNSDYYNYRDDRFLRLSIANRYRWNYYNDYFMFDNVYNRYDYNIFNPWNNLSGWNNYYYWNNFYNPYTRYSLSNPYYHPGYAGGGSYSPQTPVTISRPRAFSPNSYSNRTYSNNNLSMDRNLSNSNSNSANRQSNNTNNNSSRYNNSRYNNSNRSINNNTYSNNNANQSRSNSNTNTYSQPARSSDAPVRTYSPASSGSSSSGSSSGGGGGVSLTRGGN